MWKYLVFLLLTGCSLAAPATSTTTPNPTETPLPATEWQTITPGLERRTLFPTPDNEITQLATLRIDPAYFSFRVHYRPGAALTTTEWAEELPGAVAIINANFFDVNGNALGLIVADGVVHGQSYVDRGGTFIVQNGQPHVRSNLREPYAGEPLEQAVQAFPMLVLDGVQAYTDPRPDRFTRRTVIAQDTSGRIILLTTPLIGLPLLDLSAYLPQAELSIVNAFNLDGGGSTLMVLLTGGTPEYIVASLDAVPAVLAVYPR